MNGVARSNFVSNWWSWWLIPLAEDRRGRVKTSGVEMRGVGGGEGFLQIGRSYLFRRLVSYGKRETVFDSLIGLEVDYLLMKTKF